MLIDIATGRPVSSVPFARDFERVRDRLSADEFDAMVAHVNRLIDEAGAEIATAGWLPGSDWTGTPFEPIYTRGTRGDFAASARFFGLLVCYTVMRRPEPWASGRYQLDGKDIRNR